jgi:hypothetical protein
MESDGHYIERMFVLTKCGFQPSAHKLKFTEAESGIGSPKLKNKFFLKMKQMK